MFHNFPSDKSAPEQLDEFFMQQALREARRAAKNDEVPVGAVVVHEGVIIARAHNQVELLRDGTAHAEMLALTQAQSALEDWRLNECQLYVTKEPCPMCAGAIVNCRVGRVVYGCEDPKFGAAGGKYNLLQEPDFNHYCEITKGVAGAESLYLLQEFFQGKRKKAP